MTERQTPPSIEDLKLALAHFDAAVDAGDMLGETVHAAVCTSHLQRIVDCLESGEYALLSREDRGAAIELAIKHGSRLHQRATICLADEQQARALLALPELSQ